MNEIIKPKSESTIVINTKEGETSDEQKVAETLNTFFVEKISKLKESVDPNLVKDPLLIHQTFVLIYNSTCTKEDNKYSFIHSFIDVYERKTRRHFIILTAR